MHFNIEIFYTINLGNDSTALGDIIQIQSCLRQGSYQVKEHSINIGVST